MRDVKGELYPLSNNTISCEVQNEEQIKRKYRKNIGIHLGIPKNCPIIVEKQETPTLGIIIFNFLKQKYLWKPYGSNKKSDWNGFFRNIKTYVDED